MDGWIKLYRKVLENPVACKDSDYLAVWIYLLLNATHKETPALFKGKKIMLQPGQLITGRYIIAQRFNVTESKIKRILIELEIDRQIDRQRSNKNSLITILNWDIYQDGDRQIDQQMTDKRPTDDRQMTTNKNKRNKEIKNLKTYSDFPELNEAILQFIEFRKKIKAPMTDRAIELLISNLNKLSTDISVQVAILNQSILNGWKGVFALKQDQNPVLQTKSKNKQLDYPQRTYTPDQYADLERKLLNKGL